MLSKPSGSAHDLRLGRSAGAARVLLVAIAATLAPAAAPAQDLENLWNPLEFNGQVAARIMRPGMLDLESAVQQAELILAARLVDVTETKIVHGGRNVEVTQQFRLEPVRVLKGIYARDELLMTGQDLGVYRFANDSERLERGQLLLVLLGRQGSGFINCNCAGVPTLGQSIPRLAGKDDPLLTAVEVLIGMTRQRDRALRVAALRDRLSQAKERDSTPLLAALERRAFLAARDPKIAGAVLPHLQSPTPVIREAAARTLAAMLATLPVAEGREPVRLQSESASALAAALRDSGPDLAARVAAIDALAAAGGPALARTPAALEWLRAPRPAATFAEMAARCRVLAQLGAAGTIDDVVRLYEGLYLDAPAPAQDAAGRALVRLDAGKAGELISARLARKDEEGLDVSPEIMLLGALPRAIAAPALLKAWSRSLDLSERLAFARASAVVADAQLVPAVASLLDPRQGQVRGVAVAALMRIDTDEAASALWPHLDEELDVAHKLRLIAFLGRHGFRDGYAQALEHLSRPDLRDDAVTAIAAIGDPNAIPELRRIWQTSNDLDWNAAAIRGLGRLGQKEIVPRLLTLARTPGDPLADSAILALGDLAPDAAVPIVRQALNSRRDATVIAATRAARALLAHAELNDDGIRSRLAALLADADASPSVREETLRTLVALNDRALEAPLGHVVRDANLEGFTLLVEAEKTLRKRELAKAAGTPE